jgi:hypothetical protein
MNRDLPLVRPIALALVALLLPLIAAPAVANSPADPVRAIHAQAERAFQALQTRFPDADVSWRDGQAGPEVVTGLHIQIPGATTPQQAAETFLREHQDLLGIPARDLKPMGQSRSRDRVVVRFSQQVQTAVGVLPVLDRYVTVTLDAQGRILTLASDAMPVRPFTLGRVAEPEARTAAVRAALGLHPDQPLPVVQTVQGQVVVAHPGRALHAWAVDVTVTPRVDRRLVLVDAVTGLVVHQQSVVLH